jgi:outer membrane protein OmpA-like peptidoglycan-associated protein
MKSRIFVTLFMSTVLGLPAFAQQSNSNSGAPPAAPTSQSVDTGDREPPLRPAPSDFWEGEEPNLVNLVSHPFASKKYVRRLVQPIQDRVNELDELTAASHQMIKDVDARAQHGLQLVSEKTNEADQHATDAGNKAEMAKLTATQATTRVSTTAQVVGNIDQYKASTQTEIRFLSGQSVLSKQAKEALDEMASPLKDQHSYIIEVQGFAQGHGQAAIAASQKMADSVVRYLVLNHNVPVHRIYVLGMGNAPGTTAKHARGGRVEVSLLKNDLSPMQH